VEDLQDLLATGSASIVTVHLLEFRDVTPSLGTRKML
jgi:hypothetical protein